MNDAIYDNYRRAGKIAADARKHGSELIRPGVQLLEVAQRVEMRIREQDAALAFPVNISINEIAAHSSPRHDDTIVFTKGDVVKLDVGAHVDGYIADTAITVEVGTKNYEEMIKASRHALDNAVAMMKAGVDLSEIGKTIEATITSYTYKTIDNLTGHSMERYALHSGKSVPNVADEQSHIRPVVGDVLAIEPFATNGAGHVISGKGSNIFIYNASVRSKLIRNQQSRLALEKIKEHFHTLPFAERWCAGLFSDSDHALSKLTFAGAIKQYPQLIDASKGIVTQAEHTVIVHEDRCEVIT